MVHLLHKGLAGVGVVAAAVALAFAPASAQTASPSDVGGDPVVARVNGEEIHRSQVFAEIERRQNELQGIPLEELHDRILDQLIDTRLLLIEGRLLKLDQDERLKRELARIEEVLIIRLYAAQEIAAVVTEDALRARYEDLVEETAANEEVSARHILVETEEEALAVIAELAAGTDFAALAEARSVGPSAAAGGDLGYFRREDLVPAFAEPAFALQVGETSAPVKTMFGWHVIRVEDRRIAQPPSFDQVVDELRSEMSEEVVAATLKRLRTKAQIELFNPDGSLRAD